MRTQTDVRLTIQFPGTKPGAPNGAPRSLKEILVEVGASQVRAYSSVGLERTPDKREVGGSNPPRPTSSDDQA